jgi:hypothetical protein
MAVTGYLFYSTTIEARLCVPPLSKFRMAGLLKLFLGSLLQEWCVTNVISLFRVQDQACHDIFKVALIPPLPFGDRLVLFCRILPLLVGTTLVPKWPIHALFFYKTYG